jgi:hypothetical protein
MLKIIPVRKSLSRSKTTISKSNKTYRLSNNTQPSKDSFNNNLQVSQIRLCSTKRSTFSYRSVSESTDVLSNVFRPINLKKHTRIIKKHSSCNIHEDPLQQLSQRKRSSISFIPTNAISVYDRKLIRKVTQQVKNGNQQSSNSQSPKRTNSLNLVKGKKNSSQKKPINLFLSTQSNSTDRKTKENKKAKKTRNIKLSLNDFKLHNYKHFFSFDFKKSVDFYLKESQKYQRPNISGSVRSPSGSIMKPVHSCSLYMKPTPSKSNLIQRLIRMYNNDYMPFKFKQVIKWEGIRQLWLNHSIILEKLIHNYNEYKWFLEKTNNITEKTLREFMRLIEIKSNNEFFKDIFELFGCNKKSYGDLIYNQTINKMNIKEFFQCIVIASVNVVFEVKLNMLCNIWENVNTKKINVKEVIFLLKGYLYFNKDYATLAMILHKKFPNEQDTEISRNDFYNYITTHPKLILILRRNLLFDQNKIDKIFQEEVLNIINSNEYSWKSHLNEYDVKIYSERRINRLDFILSKLSELRQRKQKNKEYDINNKKDIKYKLNVEENKEC